MKNIGLLTVGIIFLALAGIYGFAAATDYKKILLQCIGFDVVSLVCFGLLLKENSGNIWHAAILLLIVGIGIAGQAVFRLF